MTDALSILRNIKTASYELRSTEITKKKNACLAFLKHTLESSIDEILQENQKDLNALPSTATAAFRDRLALNYKRIHAMATSIQDIIDFDDPVGQVVQEFELKNTLQGQRVRSPFGVIFIIFESRPNVAIDSFSLALKSGNAVILRGGKESVHTTTLLYKMIKDALRSSGLTEDLLLGITDPNREYVKTLLAQNRFIDLVIPRGSEQLIEFVVTHSKIPILKNDRGMCHVYIHEDADDAMAIRIVENAKASRPGVCNSMETLLIHKNKINLLPELYDALSVKSTTHPQVEWYCDDTSLKVLYGKPHVFKADTKSFDTEYLDYKMNCKVIDSLDEALKHIELHSSNHSESIVTNSASTAQKFQNTVDSACVYWNASTRFTDGFELGLGGEIGISTQKLHARGPVGLRELTSIRWIFNGKGQVRT